ncbi:hypothetical protein [Actinokineospora globicatena]|uniref:Uncharacterized protein n=1 Tax=Actinokineospora globicatena TaxID=103729 RepID=A0A9W6QVB9_9PSEU|nr:hypothetical protein [Actinokineospora globicatena]MCP2302176.1 hypothetical protein [Actinokineospora globicatena]GLW76162.1 hypothetical protein Aglo01_06440 [Actinokineospora globicatena]GLW82998.1 hypothetical protein Aglo02_06380 [Actinokineospora globicatena]GLW95279.1 hypothetical protein Aglo03_60950 [Actinokineospora globicatena]
MRVLSLVLAAILGAVVGIGAGTPCALPHRGTPVEQIRADQETLVRGLGFSAVEQHNDLVDDGVAVAASDHTATGRTPADPGLRVIAAESTSAGLLARGPPRGR